MNTEKRLQIVTFTQAQRLKAAGFDWECELLWNLDDGESRSPSHRGESYNWNTLGPSSRPWFASAPTVAGALKWARDVRFLDGHVEVNGAREYGWNYVLSYFERPRTYGSYKSHEEAESALLDAVLDQIEKEEGVWDESAAVPD